MTVQIVSTTDSEADVTAAMGGLSENTEEAAETKETSASQEAETEATEDETSENEDTSQEENDEDEGEDKGDEDKEGAEQKPKKPGGFKRRIDKLTKRLSAKDQEVEYWRQEALKKADKDAGGQETTASAKTTGDASKPSLDDYDTHEDYVEALTEYKLEIKLQERAQKESQEKLKSSFNQRVSKHQERVQAFAEKVEDFADVIEDVDDIPMSLAVQELILDSDNGPELMYELAKDPAEYKRICALEPLAAARAVGRIEAKLSKSEETKKPIKTTKAPPPITPLKGKGSAPVKDIYDPTLSFKEFERLERERLAKLEAM